MTATLLFYKVDQPYGCFSNFSPHPLVIEGERWPTSEHYFQAKKFLQRSDREAIRCAPTPFIAAQMGRDRNRPLRDDWLAVRDEVMGEALAAKFSQHLLLREILLSTGDSRLVEHTRNDAYWADGGNGRGRNRLGELLMELRIRLQPDALPFFEPPWIKFPGVEVSDLHWRMGEGESYLIDFQRWLAGLSAEARGHFEAYFKRPPEWARSV